LHFCNFRFPINARKIEKGNFLKTIVAYALFACLACDLAEAADKLAFGSPPTWVLPAKALPSGSDIGPSSGHLQFLLVDRQAHFAAEADEYYAANVVRIRSPEGLNGIGTLSLAWDPQTTQVTVHAVRILRGESVINVLANQDFTILRREKNLEFASLDGTLTATIQPADLRVGDTVEFSYTMRRSDPVFAGNSEILLGQLPNFPISQLRMHASWLTERNIQWKASESMVDALQEHRDHDLIDLTGEVRDVQPLVQPKGAPLRFRQLREVQFSSFRAWKDISKLLTPLYDKAATLEPGSAIKKEVDAIREASSNPVTQVEAALTLTEDKIRYVYLGMNSGNLVPATADATWTRRFGDCKAKTAILLAILRQLGIQAEPAVVSLARGDGLNEKIPMIEWFDHVLVKAKVGGRTVWLDGTRLGDRRLANLPDPAFRWALPLTAKGSDIIRVDARPLDQPSADVKVQIDASKGIFAPAPFHAEIVLQGDAALALNRTFANLGDADRERSLREGWKNQYNFIDVGSVATSFDGNSATYRSIVDGVAHMDWSSSYYETDGLGVGFEANLDRQPGPHVEAPYAVPFPVFSRVTEVVVLPHGGVGFTVDGEDINRTVGGVEYRRHAVIDKDRFTAESTTRALAPEFPYADAKSVESNLRQMSKQRLFIKEPASYAQTQADKEQVLSKTPATSGEFVTRGNQYMDDNSYDLAIADFDSAIALDRSNDMAFADRGMAEVHKGATEKGSKDLETAYSLNAKNPVVFRGRAILARKHGKMQAAIDSLTTSLTLDPDSAFAYWNRAEIYESIGEFDKALEDAAQAIKYQPDALPMYWLRAGILIRQKRVDEALAVAESEIAANPDNASAYAGAAGIFERANHHERAMPAVNRAVELQPTDSMYLWRERLRNAADLDARRADAEAAVKYKPQSTEARSRLAFVQYLSHRYQDELDTLDTLDKDPTEGHLYVVWRAIAHMKSGQSDVAKRDLAEAISLATRGRDYDAICRQLAIANEELDTALQFCDKAIENSAGQAIYYADRGLVLLRMNRSGDAAAAFTEALGMDSANDAAQYGRGIAELRSGRTDAGKADLEAAEARNWYVARTFEDYGIRP
jgi:tetratricopeptide (TPR) repeat protein